MATAVRDDSAKAARKKKIQQLEASLFGKEGGQGATTALPELQKVDEYASYGGKAERKKTSALPALRKPIVERKTFFSIGGRNNRRGSRSDEEELLDSSGGSGGGSSSRETPVEGGSGSTLGTPPALVPPPPPTAQSRAGDVAAAAAAPMRRKSIGGQTAHTLLKSEVEQLDDSIRHLVADPKAEVLENIKKRHGIKKSPSLQMPDSSGVYTFPQGSLTSVAAAEEEQLGSAERLRRNSRTGTPGSAGRRRTISLDRTTQILQQEQADLEKTMKKIDPRFSHGQIKPPPTAESTANGSTTSSSEFQWPTMPEIKQPALPVNQGRRDSLQPLTLSNDKKPNKRQQAQNAPTSPGLQGHGRTPDPTQVNPFDETFNRATKLPAIGGAGIPVPRVPSIKINTSPRPRRDPQKEKTVPHDDSALSEPRSDQSPKASLVNFENLERPTSEVPAHTFEDVPDTLGDVPTNTLENMPTSTFDEIPSNVFDAIPTAIREREKRRIENRRANSSGAEENRLVTMVTQSRSGSPSPAAGIYMAERAAAVAAVGGGKRESDDEADVMVATTSEPPNVQLGAGAVSLLTALFPNAVAMGRHPDSEQIESDYVFALFIQEQEQATSNDGNPALKSEKLAGRRRGSAPSAPPMPSAPPPPPLSMATAPVAPAPSKSATATKETDDDDPDAVGHFCAPFCPGFCEANFCVFHAPKDGQKADG